MIQSTYSLGPLLTVPTARMEVQGQSSVFCSLMYPQYLEQWLEYRRHSINTCWLNKFFSHKGLLLQGKYYWGQVNTFSFKLPIWAITYLTRTETTSYMSLTSLLFRSLLQHILCTGFLVFSSRWVMGTVNTTSLGFVLPRIIWSFSSSSPRGPHCYPVLQVLIMEKNITTTSRCSGSIKKVLEIPKLGQYKSDSVFWYLEKIRIISRLL